jgi:hypothetical protein
MRNHFAHHGSYSIDVLGTVVSLAFYGATNREMALSYIESYEKATKQLKGTRYAHFVIFRHWQLAPPEAQEELFPHREFMIRNGCTTEAFVIRDGGEGVIQRSLILNREPTALGDTDRSVFDDPRDAARWLTDRGFPLDPEKAAALAELPVF